MNHYEALISAETRQLLADLAEGILGIGLYPMQDRPCDGYIECSLQLKTDDYVRISCIDHSLEWKFEVFTPTAERTPQCPYPVLPLENWSGNNHIYLLRNEEWVECGEDSGNLIGRHPLMQSRGKPAMAPADVLARCTVDAGVAIENDNGESLIIAASMFPLWLYVSGFTTSRNYHGEDFDRVPI